MAKYNNRKIVEIDRSIILPIVLRTRPKRAWAHAQSSVPNLFPFREECTGSGTQQQPRHSRGRWEMINYIYHLPSAAGDTEYLQWLDQGHTRVGVPSV